MASYFPFLRLPRELRDEMYKYFATRPPPEIPQALQLYDPSTCSRMSLDLSILRVNKQIHEEASRVFYGQTVFPVRIMVSDWRSPISNRTQFEVIYDTPWEEMVYSYDENGKSSYRGHTDFDPAAAKCVADEDLDAYTMPSPRYRELIRHVRIDILNNRRSLERRNEQGRTSKAARERVRKILMPFAYRLETVLGDAGKALEVEINVVSETLQEENGDGQNFIFATSGTETTEVLSLYKQLIETAWPFTTGPWTYKLNLPANIGQRYPGLGAEVLRWCDEHDEMAEEEKSEFRKLRTRYPYMWAFKNGRLMVMEEVTEPIFNDSYTP
ncbi:hypothetical protein TWF281_004436 [Arthrobotrys megalospora]